MSLIVTLQVHFRAGKLTSSCEREVVTVLREAALNYKLNPLLKALCSTEVCTLSYLIIYVIKRAFIQ